MEEAEVTGAAEEAEEVEEAEEAEAEAEEAEVEEVKVKDKWYRLPMSSTAKSGYVGVQFCQDKGGGKTRSKPWQARRLDRGGCLGYFVKPRDAAICVAKFSLEGPA